MRKVALACVAALALAGCGSEKPSDEDQIKETVTSYYKAFGQGESDTACGELARETREELEKASGGQDCGEVLGRVLKQPDYAKLAAKLEGVKVSDVKIAAGQATARAEVPGVAAAGGGFVQTVVPLKKEGGAWKIASAVGEE